MPFNLSSDLDTPYIINDLFKFLRKLQRYVPLNKRKPKFVAFSVLWRCPSKILFRPTKQDIWPFKKKKVFASLAFVLESNFWTLTL